MMTDYAQGDSADAAAPTVGPAYSFDAETDRYPNGHDSLMRRLAALVSPTLDSTVFEETAPPVGDEKSPYEIRAYSGGQRFRRSAKNHGDWYDIEAVLDLMNALMVEHQRAERFHVLTSDGQMVTVVVATPEAMTKAAEAGLAGSSDPDRARNAGQDAERQVFEQLDNQ